MFSLLLESCFPYSISLTIGDDSDKCSSNSSPRRYLPPLEPPPPAPSAPRTSNGCDIEYAEPFFHVRKPEVPSMSPISQTIVNYANSPNIIVYRDMFELMVGIMLKFFIFVLIYMVWI